MEKESRNGKPFYRLPLRTMKQVRYVEGVLDGKTKKDAALDAGYSESSSKCPSRNIEGPAIRAAFQQIIREAIPLEKFKERMAEGVDAKVVKYFQFEGSVTDERVDVDYTTRLEYLKTAAKFGGYYIEKAEIDVHDTTDVEGQIDELFSLAAQRYFARTESGGTDQTSQSTQG